MPPCVNFWNCCELEEQIRLQQTDDFREGTTAAAQRRSPMFIGR